MSLPSPNSFQFDDVQLVHGDRKRANPKCVYVQPDRPCNGEIHREESTKYRREPN